VAGCTTAGWCISTGVMPANGERPGTRLVHCSRRQSRVCVLPIHSHDARLRHSQCTELFGVAVGEGTDAPRTVLLALMSTNWVRF